MTLTGVANWYGCRAAGVKAFRGHPVQSSNSTVKLVAGLRYDPDPRVRLSFEYVRSIGFAPLIDITTVSDHHVVQNSLVMGLVLSI